MIGSSKHSNEQSYLLRKWVSLCGSNNCDHQARICHSTTVAGVANTWGYGAMTNSYNDMQNSKVAMYIGSNAAEAHPVSMLHMLHAKETGCKMIVVDPRFTRTAAKADEYVRIRSGTDIAFLFGLLYHIFKNGWEDKKYIDDRVYGMDKVKADVLAKWTPDKVEEACGVKPERMLKIATMLNENRPGTIVWCMGQTQHTIGNAIVRASCILQLALGNIGASGGGANIFRGHDNVQGATDVGPNPDSLPGYYGIVEGSWKHFASAWGVDYDWIKGRFGAPELMSKPGITVSRWIDGVLEKNEMIDQPSNLRGVFFWGHAPNSQTRGLEMKRAMDKLDLLVVIDPYPSATAAMAAMPGRPEDQNPNRAVYLLPAATQFETSGSVTASNRSLQWREKVIEPLWESRSDHMIMYQFAQKLGFGKELVKNYKMQKVKGMDEPDARGHPARDQQVLLDHRLHRPEPGAAARRTCATWERSTSRRSRPRAVKDKVNGYDLTGDYFGLPWPCYGTPELKHPGSPNLYDTSQARDGRRRQLPRQLRRGARRQEPAGRGRLAFAGRRHHDRLPGTRPAAAQEARLVGRTHRRREEGPGRGQELEDRPLGRHDPRVHEEPRLPSVRQRQGARRGVELPGRDSAAPRAASTARGRTWWPSTRRTTTRRPSGACPRSYKTLQQKNIADKVHEKFPLHPDLRPAGRIRGRRRGNALQPLAGRTAAGDVRRDQPQGGGRRRASATATASGCTRRPARRLNVQALVTERVGPDTVFMPVPLLRPLAGRGHAGLLPERRGAGGARRGGQHRHDLRLRQRDDDAGDQDDDLQRREEPEGERRWHE